MKHKRSEYTYMDIVRNLMWYYWYYYWWEDSAKYYKLYRIANAKFYKNNFKRDG